MVYQLYKPTGPIKTDIDIQHGISCKLLDLVYIWSNDTILQSTIVESGTLRNVRSRFVMYNEAQPSYTSQTRPNISYSSSLYYSTLLLLSIVDY